MVRSYVAQGLQVSKTLQIAEISHNQYYHQSTGGKPGREVTITTQCMIQGQIIECANTEVVEEMEKILKDPDLQYGYKRMTAAMLLLGYLIGYKKVYRLMKENGLLQQRRKPGNRKRVRYRRVFPTRPLEVLEMDIKYQWVEEYQRDAYIFTILDTFTRAVPYRYVGYHIRQQEVKAAWEYVIVHILQPLDMLNRKLIVEVRNDNGPQFAAKLVQKFFAENQLLQVFTHPYTPEENGHIESFHAILDEHLSRFTFYTLAQLEENIERFYEKYNRIRLHGSIACLPPLLFWNLFNQGSIESVMTKRNKRVFKLTVPYWELSGNESLREFPVQSEVRRTSKKERAAA
ncbi:MAG TPA: DDE-type integrase/transposase/recombinase [Saprospiraceae bacterium]|nr:DDE-type integrase/transposase/recombinase [Saprospiraceae bacterium]